MTHPAPRARRNYVVTSTLVAAAICLLPAAPALALDAPTAAPAAVAAASSLTDATAALAVTPWVTSGAVDQDGNAVALDDPRAANFVGNAYFNADGSYTMFTLGDDAPKLHGDWEMREVDGELVRWINAKNAAGEVQWERIVPIVDLDASVFTYRVVNAEDPTQWVDIIHTPTDYSVTGNATAELAATPWVTSNAIDQDGNTVALDDPRAANFVGNAYFKTDGTYTMYNLDDSPKLHGDWEMRIVEGQLVRWINAKNDAGEVLWERIVPITQLDNGTFTYRVAGENGAYVDIVHTPTDHEEPGTDSGERPGNSGNNGNDRNQGNNGNQGNHGNQSNNGNGNAGQGNQGKGHQGNNGQGKGHLAETGGVGPVAAVAGSFVAMLGGTVLVALRALKRRLG